MNFTHLDRFLQEHAERLGIPGLSCAVMKDGKLVYQNFQGAADLESGRPVREDTVFRIYSMTKPFTVVAALQLYEQGKFDLQDPISNFLPEFKETKVFRMGPSGVITTPPSRPVRFLDLLTCTSGWSYYADKGSSVTSSNNASTLAQGSTLTATALSDAMYELELRRPNKTFTNREFARTIAGVPLAFEPGSHWMYGMSFDVLGAVIEEIAGMTLDEYCRKYICTPLGLKDTGYHLTPDREARLCSYYNISDPAKPVKFTTKDDYYQPEAKFERGGGGMLSTLPDYMTFADTLRRGGTSADGAKILGRKTVDLMRANHLGSAQMADINWPSLAGYGYGFGVRTLVDPTRGGTNSSVGEYGWSGSAGTWMAIDPKEELTVCLMKQTYPAWEGWIIPRFRAALWGSL